VSTKTEVWNMTNSPMWLAINSFPRGQDPKIWQMLNSWSRDFVPYTPSPKRADLTSPGKKSSCLVYGYGSIPINTIFRGMNIHLPAILGFTRYQGFDPSPYNDPHVWSKHRRIYLHLQAPLRSGHSDGAWSRGITFAKEVLTSPFFLCVLSG